MAGPRAVVDNNLAISYLLTRGETLRRLFQAWLVDERFVHVVSPPIVEELRDVLERPRLRQRMVGDPAELFEAIERLAEWTAGEPVASGVCRDPKDDKFPACAVEGNVQYVVTGDADLLALGQFRGIRVVTAAQFLALLESG